MLDMETLAFMEEVASQYAGKYVAPPFLAGRKGRAPRGTWLLNNDVPTNKTGLPISFDDGYIRVIQTKNERDNADYELEVWEHDGPGSVFTLKHTIVVVNAIGGIDEDLKIALTKNKQLGFKINDGSAKNVKVALFMTGRL